MRITGTSSQWRESNRWPIVHSEAQAYQLHHTTGSMGRDGSVANMNVMFVLEIVCSWFQGGEIVTKMIMKEMRTDVNRRLR